MSKVSGNCSVQNCLSFVGIICHQLGLLRVLKLFIVSEC